jgi:hypothetical protein
MDKISELRKILGETFIWNKARLDCLVSLLLALFAVRTVNLSEIAVAFTSKAEVSSRYKRIQRFFGKFKIDYSVIARWIFKLFFSNDKSLYLLIDRTNWFWGKSKINVFTLAIAYEGLAIPIFWKLLPKAGSSSVKEQRELIECFINEFGKERILGVLGDREFASGKLFKWFNKEKIGFYIRIKEGSNAFIRHQKFVTAKKLFNHLNPNQQDFFGMAIWIFGQQVYLAGSRSERGELMIVATNRSPKNAIAVYLRRWEIESLFASLKSKGFRFEDTHMTQLDRIEKLMAILAIGFCWGHKVGEWKAIKKPIAVKKHRDNCRPQSSFFRYGFDFIREIILNPLKKLADFRECLAVLSPKNNYLEAIL